MTHSRLRILIADDHPVVRAGLATMIEIENAGMSVVGQAGNGSEAVEMWRALRPDVSLMDLRMPEMDGVSAIAAIRKLSPAAKIIVLTTYDGDEDIYQALRAGARGYLLKDAPRETLLDAIHVVHGGGKFISHEVALRLAGRVGEESLSPREKDVLHLVAQGKSNREIAASLLVSERTVKFHINNLLDKLSASSRTEAVAIAARRGLVRLD
jgi:two-component system NarL family response regulator